MKCKFHKKCPLFDSEGVTCNSYDAENGYCGKYQELTQKIRQCEICKQKKNSVRWRETTEGSKEICRRCQILDSVEVICLIPVLFIAFIILSVLSFIGVFKE